MDLNSQFVGLLVCRYLPEVPEYLVAWYQSEVLKLEGLAPHSPSKSWNFGTKTTHRTVYKLVFICGLISENTGTFFINIVNAVGVVLKSCLHSEVVTKWSSTTMYQYIQKWLAVSTKFYLDIYCDSVLWQCYYIYNFWIIRLHHNSKLLCMSFIQRVLFFSGQLWINIPWWFWKASIQWSDWWRQQLIQCLQYLREGFAEWHMVSEAYANAYGHLSIPMPQLQPRILCEA